MRSITKKLNRFRCELKCGLLCLAGLLFAGSSAHAGLTFEVHLVRFNGGQLYKFFTPIYTNSGVPAAPQGTYLIYSPNYIATTNGAWRALTVDSNGVNSVDGNEIPYSDFNSVVQQITNGTWSVIYTNITTTNYFTFKVSAPTITSNMLPATVINSPANGAFNVPNPPTLTWLAPAAWSLPTANTYLRNYDFSFGDIVTLPAGQTNWTPAPIPVDGLNCIFNLSYITNNYPLLFTATTPLNTNAPHAQISEWDTTNTLETGDNIYFTVTNPPVAVPFLVAHYTFDDANNVGADSSGNGYDLDFNGGDFVTSTNDARVGGGSAYFDGNSFLSYNSISTNILNTLAGDFSLSFWVKTRDTNGNENGDAWAGDAIVGEDIPGSANDLVPAAIDGGQIGFNTGGGSDDTVNSTVNINDGSYHHVVITRKQSTGEKQIYLDGVLNNSDSATMNPLSDPHLIAIGCAIDASQSDPNIANPDAYFQGELDDMQLYAGVLSSSQVAAIYASAPAASGLIAHYTFDDSAHLGHDSSGNGLDLTYNGHPYGGGVISFGGAAVGTGAAYFDGGSFFSYTSTPSAVLNAFASDFSLSFWIKTTEANGNEGGFAFNGSGIVAADLSGQRNDIIPAALDGGEIGFNNGPSDDTLNSQIDINQLVNGNPVYHHIVITRQQSTGEKRIYVDGVLNNSDFSDTTLLNDPKLVAIGCGIDASQSDPSSANVFNFFNGWLDDIQLYSRVLSTNQVAQLYASPGSTISFSQSPDFNPPLNTTNLNWKTVGDTSWFIESDFTIDGSAAQSGVVTNDQASTLTLTVTGPGTLYFSWACTGDNANFDYVAYTDGDPNQGYIDDLYYDTGGYLQEQPVSILAGTHTISWTAFANGDTDPNEAGFLDKVSFLPESAPTITLNPFDQTNYPGYPVWLNAAASSSPAPSWQWYKAGTGQINGATNSYYTPTNSGTSAVAGNYYAIASTDVGSSITTTAAVSFVTATLPPDWARAFKSPFQAVDESTVTRDFYYGCVVDANSNIYAAAEFGGAMTVGSQTLNSGSEDAAAVVKQSPTGSALWAAAITNNGGGSSYAQSVASAPGGGVYLAGNFGGNNWLGTNHISDAGSGDIFLARFDAGGTNVWLKTFGGPGFDFMLVNSLVSDPSGNVTVCALLGSGPVTLGSSNYTVVGQQGVIFQLDQTGAVRWSQLLPSEFPQYLAYSGGRLYTSFTTETTGGTTNFVIGGISNLTDRAWAVACLNDANGQAVWAHGVGGRSGAGSGDPYGTGVQDDVPRLAATGTNVFLTGVAYDSSAEFGPLTVNFALPRGQYFARYDTNGTPYVATTYGSTTTTPEAAVADANGNVYVSGYFDTYSFFGKDMIAAPAHPKPGAGFFSQAFLAKFDSNGNPLWAREAVSPFSVAFLGIALAPDGVWASGWGSSSNVSSGVSIQFGTNSVFSDEQIIGGGAGGSIFVIWYPGGVLAKITDNSTAISLPITLLNPHDNNTNFQFSFQTQSGFTHSVQYRTNLISGTSWQTYTNVTGDGTQQTVPIPLSLFNPSRTGFVRVMTQ